jgi:hypothetical protein
MTTTVRVRAHARCAAPRIARAKGRCRSRAPPPQSAGADVVDAVDSGEHDIEIAERPDHWRTIDGFYARADGLRDALVATHGDVRRVKAERFCWDYWHVENQYTLLRTPAEDYFGREAYVELEEALLKYAREELGCSGITPVWMSAYVHSMRQELHADVPHGPWAFVLSLTDWDNRKFSGGETQIMRPERLNYWKNFDATEVVERGQILETIEPKFNRLTVFDPRLPHGVTEVFGEKDLLKGRIVLHGWFTDPLPSFSGALTEEMASEALGESLEALYARLTELPRASGMVCAALTVAPSGDVKKLRWTCDTLTPVPMPELPSETDIRDAIMLDIASALLETKFPQTNGESTITLPFCFE